MDIGDNLKKLMGITPDKEQRMNDIMNGKNLPSGFTPQQKDQMVGTAMDLNPIGGMVGATENIAKDFFGMHKSTDLGDVVLTKSAKDPSKFQMTLFDGKLGSSNTVKDMQFDTKEEAISAFENQ